VPTTPSGADAAGVRDRRTGFELCFTPTYASGANPIEAHFGPLQQFTLANSHHRSHSPQTRALGEPMPSQQCTVTFIRRSGGAE
jgi:hypothetical protein